MRPPLLLAAQIHAAAHPFTPAAVDVWRESLARDGYLHLDGLLPRDVVLQARRTVLQNLLERGLVAPPQDDSEEAQLSATAIDPSATTNLLSA